MEIAPIARVRNDFPQKFGLPRQAQSLADVPARVVFEAPFRDPNALRGLEGFGRLWLIWGFDRVGKAGFTPTVRPPLLGGNTRMGVFATRSPNRPNPLGLSCVRLERIQWDTPEGPVLHILGSDMTDGTAVYDIKPYLPFADAFPEAAAGFAGQVEERRLQVVFPRELLCAVPEEKRAVLLSALAEDPRPGYRKDAGRPYGLAYAGMNIRFTVDGDRLTVTDVERPERDGAPACDTETVKGLYP